MGIMQADVQERRRSRSSSRGRLDAGVNRRHGGPARWTGRPAPGATCDSGRAPLQNGPPVPFPADAPADAPPADEPEAAPRGELAVDQPALSGHWAETRGGARPEAALPPEAAPCEELAAEPPALSGHWAEARLVVAQTSVRAPAVHARRPARPGGAQLEAGSSPDAESERAAELPPDAAGAHAWEGPPPDALHARLSRSPSFLRLTAGGRSWHVLAEPARPAPDTCSVHCG